MGNMLLGFGVLAQGRHPHYLKAPSARRDLAAEKDNRRAMAWRDLAYRHIDLAMDLMRRAAREMHRSSGRLLK